MDGKIMVHKVAEAGATKAEMAEGMVYLMGLSFVIGSLFTIFILVLLDYMKRDRNPKQAD